MNEGQIIVKLKLNITDFDELARYFAKLSEKGVHFVRSNWCTYAFKKGEPQNLDYFIDYDANLKDKDRGQLIELAEKAGWNHIYSNYYTNYFCARAGTATPFYTDKPSLIQRYKRIMKWAIGISIIYLLFIKSYIGQLILALNTKDIVEIIFSLIPIILLTPIFLFCIKAIIQSILKVIKFKRDSFHE